MHSKNSEEQSVNSMMPVALMPSQFAQRSTISVFQDVNSGANT
jgi:hypothetical protein